MSADVKQQTVIATADTKPPVITQAMLEKYQVLWKEDAERRALRLEILALMDSGAPVEDGALTGYPEII